MWLIINKDSPSSGNIHYIGIAMGVLRRPLSTVEIMDDAVSTTFIYYNNNNARGDINNTVMAYLVLLCSRVTGNDLWGGGLVDL